MLIMNEFLFIDDEQTPNMPYIIMGDMPLDKLKKEFEKVYVELMNEFWNDDYSEWEYIDFYDELSWRLNRKSIMLNEPDIVCHNNLSFNNEEEWNDIDWLTNGVNLMQPDTMKLT